MISLNEIISFLGLNEAQIVSSKKIDLTSIFRGPATVSSANADDFCFIGYTAKEPEALLENTNAGLVLIDENIVIRPEILTRLNTTILLKCPNSRLSFIKLITAFFAAKVTSGIHQTAIISSGAILHETCSIGANVTIGDDVVIGKNTIIYPGVHIYNNVTIGDNVIINSGSVIGTDGFGYERQDDGTFIKFPHIGGVIIEDNVEIGGNTCIDRGTLGNTIVKKGAKIDNLVHIAHNVEIGENTLVISHSQIAGGVKIGQNSWISPSVSIIDRVSIGNNAKVGIGSIVLRNVNENETVSGNPARVIKTN